MSFTLDEFEASFQPLDERTENFNSKLKSDDNHTPLTIAELEALMKMTFLGRKHDS
jgi:hypothetical protein